MMVNTILAIKPINAIRIIMPLSTGLGCIILMIPSYIIPSEITISAKPLRKATIISSVKTICIVLCRWLAREINRYH